MEDKFIWTADLVAEFCEYAGLRIGKNTGIRQQIDLLMADFKASKLPSKEYEIVEFRNSAGDRFIIWHDGTYQCDKYCNMAWRTLTHMLNVAKDCRIYSVKKLTNGEVLSIDDVTNEGRIVGFQVYGSDLEVGFESNTRYAPISRVCKVNLALFKTDDGIEIFDGEQIVWYVDDRCKLNTRKAKNANGSPKCVKIYSNADAAESYILLNKPCLSVNDVILAMQNNIKRTREDGTHIHGTNTKMELIELVKSKINQK